MLPLIEECEHNFIQLLAVGNAAKLLSFSDRHKLHRLKTNAIKFINEYAEEVKATSDWIQLIESNAGLLLQLYNGLLHNKNEKHFSSHPQQP